MINDIFFLVMLFLFYFRNLIICFLLQSKISRLPTYLTIQFVRFFYKEKESINAKILKVDIFSYFIYCVVYVSKSGFWCNDFYLIHLFLEKFKLYFMYFIRNLTVEVKFLLILHIAQTCSLNLYYEIICKVLQFAYFPKYFWFNIIIH